MSYKPQFKGVGLHSVIFEVVKSISIPFPDKISFKLIYTSAVIFCFLFVSCSQAEVKKNEVTVFDTEEYIVTYSENEKGMDTKLFESKCLIIDSLFHYQHYDFLLVELDSFSKQGSFTSNQILHLKIIEAKAAAKLLNKQKAEKMYNQLLADRKAQTDISSNAYAEVLNGLGYLELLGQNFDSALTYFEKSYSVLDINEHKDVILKVETLCLIGIAFNKKGDYKKSIFYHEQCLKLMEDNLLSRHPLYYCSLEKMGELETELGNYKKAEEIFKKCANLISLFWDKSHAASARFKNAFGLFLLYKGDIKNSELLFTEALAIRKDKLGVLHPDYASTLNYLGDLNEAKGEYEIALDYYKQSMEIRKKVLDEYHMDFAVSLNNIAYLYHSMGLYERAEPLYLQMMDIEKKILGLEHPNYAISLNNMGNLYEDKGQLDIAETYYKKTIDLRKKIYGEQSRSYSTGLNNLGLLYYSQAEYKKAEPLFLKCKNIREEVLGKDHPAYAVSLNNLAINYRKQRAYEKAEPLLLESNEIRAKVWGKENPKYANSLHNLVRLYNDLGNYEKAADYALPLTRTKKNLFQRSFDYLSEKDKINYQNRIIGDFKWIKKIGGLVDDTELNQELYNTALFEKGIHLNSSIQTREFIYSQASEDSKLQFEMLIETKKRYNHELNKSQKNNNTIDSLNNHIEDLEYKLAKASSHFRNEVKLNKIETKNLTEVLQKSDIAIEFMHFDTSDIVGEQNIVYAASILDPATNSCHFIPLFQEQLFLNNFNLETINSKAINSIYSASNQNETSANKSLHEFIWKPLEPYLKNKKRIVYAASGILHRLNLNAIALDDTSIMADKYEMYNYLSTRSIVKLDDVKYNRKAYVVGGVEYDRMINNNDNIVEADLYTSHIKNVARRALRGTKWEPLEWTMIEAEEIAKKLKASSFHTILKVEKEATEKSFKSLGVNEPSPQIIHFATHGYFFNDTLLKTINQKADEKEEVFIHPMNKSGLILAGVNKIDKKGNGSNTMDDGYLTAFEISQMNLSDTELVVLSACETGLGDIVGSEGVYGLQRAFKMAGVKNVIMTLWQVNDRAAQEFMTMFYENYLENEMAIPEAFNSTSLKMRDQYPHPYIWAGFVLVE